MLFMWLKHYMPRSLYARVAMILVLPVVVLLLVASVVFIQRHLEDVTSQMALTAARELNVILDYVNRSETESEALGRTAAFLDAFQMTMRFVDNARVPVRDSIPWYDFSGGVVRDTFRQSLSGILSVQFPETLEVLVYFETERGPLEVEFHRRRVTAAAPHQLIVTMVFFAVVVTLISSLYMRNQLRPIKRLAAAAEAFGKGRSMPYSPSGAVEVRAAGGAFLDMRARIERQIEQRTLMLSGVSHDLRTPLTRLKLGLSMLEPDEARDLLRDVDEMQHLLDAFLDFSRGASEGQPEPVDPHALVQRLVEDAQRAGKDVTSGEFTGVGNGTVMLRAVAMRRAVENLIGNAVRYGSRAVVSVALTDKSLRIRVEDSGPGIPEQERGEAVKAFTRLDPARNQDLGGGVGLGLAIVTDVARAHGGVLRLGQSETLGGLQADIVIGRQGLDPDSGRQRTVG